MSKMKESVAVLDPTPLADLDQQIADLSRQKDEAVRTASARRAEQQAALLRSPEERQKRLQALLARSAKEKELSGAITQLDAALRNQEATIAYLHCGTVEERLDKLVLWVIDPPEPRLARLHTRLKVLRMGREVRAEDHLRFAFLECLPHTGAFLEELEKVSAGASYLTDSFHADLEKQTAAVAHSRRLGALVGRLAYDWSEWLRLEDNPAELQRLRVEYRFDLVPADIIAKASALAKGRMK
jgi:hypothetical protein